MCVDIGFTDGSISSLKELCEYFVVIDDDIAYEGEGKITLERELADSDGGNVCLCGIGIEDVLERAGIDYRVGVFGLEVDGVLPPRR